MREVTTTMEPDKVLEVDETEYIDLKRQGLIATESDEYDGTDGAGDEGSDDE